MKRPLPWLRGVLAAPAAALLVGCASAGAAGGGGGPLLYAPNQDDGTVSVIDAERLEVVGTVDLAALGFGPNAKPHHVVVEPDGSHWYVSLIGANAVLKLDRSNGVVARIDFEVPGLMALDAEREVLWVGRSMSAVNPPRRIGRIDLATLEVEEVDVFVARPHALAVAADGRVYTASLAENRLATLPADGEEAELADVPGEAHLGIVQFALSPDGRTLVATAEMSGELLVFDLAHPAAPELVERVAVGSRPWHPVWAPDGGRVYFGTKGSDEVKAVDTGSWQVKTTVKGGGLVAPHGAALSADGDVLFVSGNGRPGGTGSVMAIDLDSFGVLRVLTLGHNVAGLGTARGR